MLDAPADGEVPVTLTSHDLGLLRAYYGTDPAQTPAAQRAAVRQALERGNQAARPRPD